MSQKTTSYLNTVKQILYENNKRLLFSCIKDLSINGLSFERFPEGEYIPSQKELTKFMASWFKYVGMSAEECRDWMSLYCAQVITHTYPHFDPRKEQSVNSHINDVYESDIIFDCECENNPLKAVCNRDCPVYGGMLNKYKDREAEEEAMFFGNTAKKIVKGPQVTPRTREVKEKYKVQFNEAMKILFDQVEKKIAKEEIVDFLNYHGFRSKTGKEWQLSTLYHELRKHKRNLQKKAADKEKAKKSGGDDGAGETNDQDMVILSSSVKEKYRSQYEKALEFISDHISNGTSRKEILILLNERGFNTKTGRKWTKAILGTELAKMKRNVNVNKDSK